MGNNNSNSKYSRSARKLSSFRRKIKNNEYSKCDDVIDDMNDNNILFQCNINTFIVIENIADNNTPLCGNHDVVTIKKYRNDASSSTNFKLINDDLLEQILDLFVILEDFLGRDLKNYYFNITYPSVGDKKCYILPIMVGIFCAYYNIDSNKLSSIGFTGNIEKTGIISLDPDMHIMDKIMGCMQMPFIKYFICSEDHKNEIDQHDYVKLCNDKLTIVYVKDYIDVIDFINKI